jgi:putative membrane protein
MVIATLDFPAINLSIKADSTQFGFPDIELVFWLMLASNLF